MIVTNLIGGLGNQMFQYAAGRALALKHNVELRLDVEALKSNTSGAYTQRNFELDVFKVDIKIASPNDTQPFLKYRSSAYRSLQRTFPGLFKHLYLAESGHEFQNSFFNLPSNTYLDGYWQNENYFIHIRQTLLKDFEIGAPMPEAVNLLLSQIKNGNSISVHIRRGDYINLPAAAAFHGNCSLQYYQNAIEKIKTELNEVNIFVFSDDIEWCKNNLSANHLHFVNHNHAAAWDMFLMSNCNHNIIANSSFSWWAAWLNQYPYKKVIAPKFWFKNIESKQTGIIAKGWDTLSNQ